MAARRHLQRRLARSWPRPRARARQRRGCTSTSRSAPDCALTATSTPRTATCSSSRPTPGRLTREVASPPPARCTASSSAAARPACCGRSSWPPCSTPAGSASIAARRARSPSSATRTTCARLASPATGAAGVNRVEPGRAGDGRRARYGLLGRQHSGARVVDAVAAARAAGFDDLSLDLMYGLPGQSRVRLGAHAGGGAGAGPEHLSCYLLTLEDWTPMGRQVAPAAACCFRTMMWWPRSTR